MKQRKLGEILLEMEPLILEAMETHDLQYSDFLGIIYNYLTVHYPGGMEEYEDGSRPEFYYGYPRKVCKCKSKKKKK
jgi:hypothetical protein